MSLINLESDHRSFIDALLNAPRVRGDRSPEALFDRACDQAIERAEGHRRMMDDDSRDGSVAGVAEADSENLNARSNATGQEAKPDDEEIDTRVPARVTISKPGENVSTPPKPAETATNVSREAVANAKFDTSNQASVQSASPDMVSAKPMELPVGADVAIELPPQEARTLGDLAGRLPALEILARRHGEAVARLLAGAMQVESGLPGEENLDPRPVDFARWRRDHTQVRSIGSAWKEPGFAARSESIDPALESPLENVFPLRSMGARESVISAGVTKSAQPQTLSANPLAARPAGPVATAAPEPASATNGVDVASRIEKFHAVVTRVANAVVRAADAGGGVAIVRLHPANLGRIQVEVSVESQVAAVQLAVENPQVRQAMAQDGWMLRESLAQQGLTLGEFSVRGDDAGAATFGDRRAASGGMSRQERTSREPEVQTAPTPRRDLRAARVSLTV